MSEIQLIGGPFDGSYVEEHGPTVKVCSLVDMPRKEHVYYRLELVNPDTKHRRRCYVSEDLALRPYHDDQ